MSEPNKTKPIMGCGSDDAGAGGLPEALRFLAEAAGNAFSGSRGDDEPEEPSSLVSVRKTVTTYEFDAEGLAKVFVKTAGALFRGFKWDEPAEEAKAEAKAKPKPKDMKITFETVPAGGCAEDLVSTLERSDEPAASSAPASGDDLVTGFPNLEGLEGPDGRLRKDVAAKMVSTLLGDVGLGSELTAERYAQTVEILSVRAPEKHRVQLVDALDTLVMAMGQQQVMAESALAAPT